MQKILNAKTQRRNVGDTHSDDYAEKEYGVTTEQLDRAVARVKKEMNAARKAGTLKPFTGKLKRC